MIECTQNPNMNCWVADGRTSSYLDIFGYIIMNKIIKRN